MKKNLISLKKRTINLLFSKKYRDFRLFTIGFFVSQIGFQMAIIAVNWQIYEMTRSALSLGLVGISAFVPVLIFSLFGGLVADRVDRKKLLLVTQVVLMVILFIFALLTYFKLITPVIIYLLIMLTYIALSFYQPVRQSIIPNLVPGRNLMSAISLNTLARQGAVVIGPSISGFLIAFYGVGSIYFITGVSLLLMILTILPITIPKISSQKKASFDRKSVLEGVHLVKNSPIMSSLLMLDFFATFFGSATALLPIFAVEVLKTDVKGLGLLYAATSVGGILAALLFSIFKNVRKLGIIILVSVLIYGIATIGYGLSKSFILTSFFLLLIGMGDMSSTILRNTIRQFLTPDHLRGRMTGISVLFAAGGPKLGEAEAGLVASLVSAPFSVVTGGLGCIIATLLIAIKTPQLRNYRFESSPKN